MKQKDEYQASNQMLDGSFQEQQNQVASEFSDKYREGINVQAVDHEQAIKLFQKAGIIYNPYKKFESFKYQLLNIVKSEEILVLKSFTGYFQIEIFILVKLDQENPFMNIQYSSKGNYGKIYFFNLFENQIALKTIQNKRYISIQSNFSKMIHQITIMKIASALECSVRMEKYLGFDAILYKDQIMFAMEMGKKIDHFSPEKHQDLKRLLQTLHSFGIIHFDIKPQNIVYSSYYNKVVLIDFGFSRIVKERIGFKTLTVFRGTPKFCSQQMLSILSNCNIPSYVDVYYNDLFSLKQSLLTFSLKHANVDPFSQKSIILETNQVIYSSILLQLQLYAFQYYYVRDNAQELKKIISYRQKRLFKSKAREILVFILRLLPVRFIVMVFEQLKQWRHLDEYRQVQRNLQITTQKLAHFCLQQFNIDKSQEKSEKFRPFYKFWVNIFQEGDFQFQNSFGFNVINNFNSSFIHYQKENLQKRDFKILFDYLRFDVINLRYSQKLTIAEKFKQLMKETVYEDTSPPYSQVKFFFKYFLKQVILVKPIGEWQKGHFYDVIYQLILLGVSVEDEIKLFLQIMNKDYNSITEQTIIYLSFQKLLDLIQAINLNKDIKTYYIHLFRFLKITLANTKGYIMSCNYKNQEQKNLVILLRLMPTQKLQQNRQKYLLNFYETSQQISNKVLRDLLRNIYNRMSFQFKVEYCKHQSVVRMVRDFASSLKNADLHNTMIMIKQYSVFLQVFTEFIEFDKKVKYMFDCVQIYSRLNLQKFRLMMSKEKVDKQRMMAYVRDINDCYQEQIQFGSIVNSQISIMLNKISLEQLKSSDMYVINQLFSKVEKMMQLTQNQRKTTGYYFKVFQNMNLMKMFKKMGFKSNYLNFQKTKIQAAHFIQKLKSDSQGETVEERHQILRNAFKNLICLTQYFQDEIDPRGLIKNFIQLERITQHLQIKQIWFFALHSVVFFSNKLYQFQVFSSYIQRIFQMMIDTNQLDPFFFMQVQWTDLYTHLSYFSKFNLPNKLYTLLMLTVNWICKNPFDSYIKIFRQNIDMFCQVFPKRMLYQQIRQFIPFSDIGKNPYIILYYINTAYFQQIDKKCMLLKCITLHLQRLSNFAKISILIKYYHIALTLQHFSSRKVMNMHYKCGKRYISQDKYQNIALIVQKQKRKTRYKIIYNKKLHQHKMKYLKSILRTK